ncbi:hypothetical protein ROZALSC1DRAFT_21401 [Rozella allomycis CSF55]|uniref:Transmembrane protein 198 n=1 Tax=Rozella allomycis (strain CSF55) TaxID=988480 RepID=A0A4P9YLQ4_ROZAC|nr:hypothetical protein ROZALSC1DRAFT_21401 [Rozella allomycis CSF55]
MIYFLSCLLIIASNFVAADTNIIDNITLPNLEFNGYSAFSGAALIASGLLFLFFGIKLFKPILGMSGFFSFAIIAYALLGNYNVTFGDQTQLAYFGICIAAGIVGALLSIFLWRLGLALCGGLGGLCLALFILSFNISYFQEQNPRFIFIGVITLIGFILPLFFEKQVIIIATSLIGSFGLLTGIDVFVKLGFYQVVTAFMSQTSPYNFDQKTYIMLGSFAALTLFAILIQFKVTEKNKKHFSR